MNVTLSLGPLVSLIAGILILVMPRLLNYIVALYLIIIGIIGIFGVGGRTSKRQQSATEAARRDARPGAVPARQCLARKGDWCGIVCAY